jgi:hypothetical protein
MIIINVFVYFFLLQHADIVIFTIKCELVCWLLQHAEIMIFSINCELVIVVVVRRPLYIVSNFVPPPVSSSKRKCLHPKSQKVNLAMYIFTIKAKAVSGVTLSVSDFSLRLDTKLPTSATNKSKNYSFYQMLSRLPNKYVPHHI